MVPHYWLLCKGIRHDNDHLVNAFRGEITACNQTNWYKIWNANKWIFKLDSNRNPCCSMQLFASEGEIWCESCALKLWYMTRNFTYLVIGPWCAQMIGYIMACGTCSFVCILYYLIIIVIKIYLKAWNFYNVWQVCAFVCVFKFKSISSMILFNIWYPLFS